MESLADNVRHIDLADNVKDHRNRSLIFRTFSKSSTWL